MAEQSAFLTAFDEMQKKKGGFNAPAPLESVVDTVGQAPAVQSPFSQQAAAATNPLAAPIDLSAVRQAPMLGGFEVKGAGAERFDVGTPEVPETLFSKEYTDPGGNTAAIARIEGERARANAVDPQVSVETPEEFTPTGGAGFLPASSVPVPRDTPDGATFMGDVSTGLGKLSAPFTAHSQAAGGFKPEQPATVTTSAEVAATPAGATPAVAAPVMDGSQIPQAGEEGFKFAERGSPQDYFLSNTNGGTTALSPEQITRGQEYAKQQGLNFDPTTGFSQSGEAPQVQAPQGLTTAGGQPLAEFLAGGQQKDAQGRMIDPSVDRSSFEQASADREARQAARPDFGEAQTRAAGTVTDRERRAARGDDMSDADRRDIAKANQQGASAGDIARGDKVAAANGIDRKTGKPLEGGQGVTSALDKARTAKANAETAKIISDINSANDTSNWDDGKKQAMKTQAKELAVWEINELPKLEKNISQLRAVSDALDLGKIKTGGLGDQIPGLSNWARPFFNPDAEVAKQEVSGVIMQTLKETFPGAISDGERKALIDTIFNPQLQPEDNAKLIIGYTDRLSKAMNAKVAQVKHFREFGNLEGYTGITPRDALMSGIPGTGAGGSPIEGDVNYQSDTQNKAQSLLGAQ